MKNQRKRMKNPRIRTDGYAKDIVYSLEIDRIRANSAQPRRDFDVDSIVKLADSIRRYGILQPLSVRRAPKESATEQSAAAIHQKKNIVADLLSATLADDGEEASGSQAGENTNVSRETLPQFDMEMPFEPRVSRETLPQFDIEVPFEPCVSRETSPLQLRIDDGATQAEQLTFPNLPSLPALESCRAPKRTSVIDDGCQYELVAGERRLRAAKMLGMRHVPCIIVDVDDAISAELALVENMLRENLNMFEQAAAFAHLAEKFGFTQEEIAAKLSLSQSAVANKIRLLKLTEEERQLIAESGLTERHARAFLRISDACLRENCIRYVINEHLNVGETDKYIANLLSNPSAKDAAVKEPQAPTSPEKLCSNIYKFVNRMQGVSGNCLTVNRRSDGKNVIITLTVRKGS